MFETARISWSCNTHPGSLFISIYTYVRQMACCLQVSKLTFIKTYYLSHTCLVYSWLNDKIQHYSILEEKPVEFQREIVYVSSSSLTSFIPFLYFFHIFFCFFCSFTHSSTYTFYHSSSPSFLTVVCITLKACSTDGDVYFLWRTIEAEETADQGVYNITLYNEEVAIWEIILKRDS